MIGRIQNDFNDFVIYRELKGELVEVERYIIKDDKEKVKQYIIIDNNGEEKGKFNYLNKYTIQGFVRIENTNFIFTSSHYKLSIALRVFGKKHPFEKNVSKKKTLLNSSVRERDTLRTNNIRMIDGLYNKTLEKGYKVGYIFMKYKYNSLFYCLDDLIYIKGLCNYSDDWFNRTLEEFNRSTKWRETKKDSQNNPTVL